MFSGAGEKGIKPFWILICKESSIIWYEIAFSYYSPSLPFFAWLQILDNWVGAHAHLLVLHPTCTWEFASSLLFSTIYSQKFLPFCRQNFFKQLLTIRRRSGLTVLFVTFYHLLDLGVTFYVMCMIYIPFNHVFFFFLVFFPSRHL